MLHCNGLLASMCVLSFSVTGLELEAIKELEASGHYLQVMYDPSLVV